MHTYLYIYTFILKPKSELWKCNSDTAVSAFAMTISRRKSHLTSPSVAYFSTFATKTLLKSSAISKISLTLSTATMAMVVCRRLIASLLMSNGYARQPILRSPTPRQPQRGVGERRGGLDLAEGAAARYPSFASLAKCFFLARWLKLPTFALSNNKKFNIFKTQVWKLRRFTTSSSSMLQARWKSSTIRHSQA